MLSSLLGSLASTGVVERGVHEDLSRRACTARSQPPEPEDAPGGQHDDGPAPPSGSARCPAAGAGRGPLGPAAMVRVEGHGRDNSLVGPATSVVRRSVQAVRGWRRESTTGQERYDDQQGECGHGLQQAAAQDDELVQRQRGTTVATRPPRPAATGPVVRRVQPPAQQPEPGEGQRRPSRTHPRCSSRSTAARTGW